MLFIIQKLKRISERAKLAFGTGETYKAVTLSSNSGFIRASRQQVRVAG